MKTSLCSPATRLRRALVGIARVATAACLSLASVGALAQVESLGLRDAAQRLSAGGYLLMMRHAKTEPGLGDPPQFRIDDCGTQRNLSQEGREQARAAGTALRAAGVRLDQVRSSQWCRCRDTARLTFGAYEDWPALNSFFEDRSDEPERTRALGQFARALGPPANAMLVTHQVNISAVFGVFPGQGEIVAGRWRDGRLVAEFRFLPQAP